MSRRPSLRAWARQEAHRSAALCSDSSAVRAQSRQAVGRASNLLEQIGRDHDLDLARRWVEQRGSRDDGVPVRITDVSREESGEILVVGQTVPVRGGQPCPFARLLSVHDGAVTEIGHIAPLGGG